MTTKYEQSLEILRQLKTEHPSFGIARHISTAVSDYGDIWGMTDKEFLFALQKYQAELNMDISPISDEDYIQALIEDSKHLLDKEEEDLI